ncbi:serine/threonine-protein kinase haspin-like isoform X2 [Ischnura elegans]|uniref:serine/threonine-protein kinase haspin-like isoform X2 n=1 Tax=Ischnura elegans TaxID=197161 RepID=UPI001ED86A8C|nr:serine/threonine-protein kinase haspin-like isoform X2 [Ischnura elegans]
MLKKQLVFSGNSSESEEIDGGNRAKKKMRKNKVKSVGRKRKRGVSFVSKPLRLTHVSSKLDRVEPHHCLFDSFSFEESPFSKVAKTARKEGLQFVSFDWFGSPSEFNGKNCDSSGCVSHSRSSSDKSNYRKSSLLSSEISGSPVTPSLLSQGAPQSVSVPREVVQCSLENALTGKSAECLSSEAKSSQFRVSPQQMIEGTPTPPLPTPSLYALIHRGDFRKSRQTLFTSTPVTGENLRLAQWQLTCSPVESESMDHFSELFKDILYNSSKDSVESASPLVMTEFSSNDLRSSSGDSSNSVVCAAKEALFRVCRQSCAVDFSSYIADRSPALLEKIGEGVFSEVFGCLDRQGTRSVWKVQPFEGDLIFNGEEQKMSADILSEILITSSLSDLRSGEKLMTECFVKALDFKCVHCPFPKVLLDCWREYDDKKEG